MAANSVKTNGANEPKPLDHDAAPTILPWINEEHFIDVLRETCPGLTKVIEFEAQPTGGAGENYASIILRIKAKLELEGSDNCICCYGRSNKDVAYIIKTIPQTEQVAQMITSMGLFPKETAMYSTYLPEFEQLYRNVGKKVTFGPKFYTLKKNPGAEYILLEDLSPRGFENVNRLEGLDKEHSESVLRLLADLHAASAVRYETKGKYDELFSSGVFNEQNRPFMKAMFSSIKEVMLVCIAKYNVSKECLQKVYAIIEESIDLMIKLGTADPDDFNVLNHGDLWANNIMFRHNDEGKLLETIFVDLQISRYGSPAVDLYYFLLSSTNLELKLSHFDYFVKYYHDHLVESLKLLKYPKQIPSLKYLHMQLLKYNILALSTATGVMAPVLLDPTSEANMDNFVKAGEEGKKFKMMMYGNARYTKHMEAILPWMETRGLLDI